MKRPAFTVETNTGSNYDANHLMICWAHDHSRWIITFVCSGILITVPAEMIKEIRFSKEGAAYCNECDGPVPVRG